MSRLKKIWTSEYKNRIKVSFFIFFIFLGLFIYSSFITPVSNSLSAIPTLQNNVTVKIIGVSGIIFMIILFLFFSTLEIVLLNKNMKKKVNWITKICTLFFLNALTLTTSVFLYYLLHFSLTNENVVNVYYLLLSISIEFLFVAILFKNLDNITWKKAFFKSIVNSIVVIFAIMLFLLIIYSGWTGLLFVCIIVWSTDIFGYEGGIRFGKHKIAPLISPKKTTEGACFSIVGSLLLTVISFIIIWYGFHIFPIYPFVSATNINNVGILVLILTSILFSLIAIIGDLFFSLVKRKYNIKDFSNIFQKHGGILDRFDSFSFVTIIFTIFIIIGQ